MEKNGTVYHGGLTKNWDGANRIIEKNKACLFPTSTPFWKDLEVIPSGARTRSQEKNQKLVKKGEYNRYFKQKKQGQYSEMARGRRLRSAFVRGTGQILRCALIVVGTFIIFIVNNSNILTDGCRYRKRPPKIEMWKNTKIN